MIHPAPLLWRADGGPVVDRPAALRHLAGRDPALGRLIARVGPPTLGPPRRVTPFGFLLRAITGQQLSVRAAATIYGRLADLYRPGRPTPARVLATPPPVLRSAGLSAAKTRAVLDLARQAAGRHLPGTARLRRMAPEEVIEALTVVRGVGRWTVEMLLIFHLGHADVLPLGDQGVRRGFARLLGRRRLPSPGALERHARCWRPYRSLASWYLWRASEMPPG
jgi:DNA-3-methyladenine glycosylase II